MELRNDHLLLSNNENKIFFPIKKRWKTKVSVAAAAAVTSVVSDPVQPQRRQPTRLPLPWDSPGKNTGVGCHFLLQCMRVKSESEVAQSCPTLLDPMDCSPPGSSIHGIFQARVLEWGAIAFSVAATTTNTGPDQNSSQEAIFFFLFLKLWKYDNTFTGDLENTEQSYTIHYNSFK